MLFRSTFGWLISQYLASAEFRLLGSLTQIDYTRTLGTINEHLGDQPYSLTTRKMVKAVRDLYSHRTRKANKVQTIISRLYTWAAEAGHVEAGYNPAAGLKKLKPAGGPQEYVGWSDRDIKRFLAHCRPHAKTILLLTLHTGQRAADVADMRWSQFDDDLISVRQSKTGTLVEINCHSHLGDHLRELREKRGQAACPDAQICLNAAGKAYNAHSIGKALTDAAQAISGMPHRSMHGLRYAAAGQMTEAGCTVAEMASVLGHRTYKMGLKYASQRLRAKSAHAKMEARPAA